MRAAVKDSEVFSVGRVRVDERTAERAMLTAGTAQAKAEHETLASCILELENAAATCEGELVVVVRVVCYLRVCVAVGKDRANAAEDQARETLKKISELRALVEGLNWTVVDKRARVPELVDAWLIRVLSVVTEALSKSKGMVIEAISDVHDGLLVEASCNARGPSSARLYDQSYVLSIV